MARDITSEERATRDEMTRIYKSREHDANGYDDWGKFTAHVVHSQRIEIQRLRDLLQQREIDPGPWDDPLT